MKTQKSNQTSEAVHGIPSIAPFSVVRIGGVSAHLLEPLLLKRSSASIGVALQTERSLQELVTPLEDALYRLVPLVGEQKELRRRILYYQRGKNEIFMVE